MLVGNQVVANVLGCDISRLERYRTNVLLAILIFGSNFWDPHRKQNSGSVSNSEDSGRKIFYQIPLLKNREIGIPIPKFKIPNKINVQI